MAVRTLNEPIVGTDAITFTYRDPQRRLTEVRLVHELREPRALEFRRLHGTTWTLNLRRPAADRMEYLLELTDRNGGSKLLPDPCNPLRAPGPFGTKSVIEFPGYEAPWWLDEETPRGELRQAEIPSRTLRSTLPVLVWSAAGAGEDEPLPLLVVHDGPEYAEYASLLRFLDVMRAESRLPKMRAALLPPPGDRNQTYSASAQYARALVWEILPALTEVTPTPDDRRLRIGMGASLGALAMLHAHRLHPHGFGALYLQSGSYFRQRYDPQERSFVRFQRIARFVGEILGDQGWWERIPVGITCGTVEENLTNNRAVAAALADHDYDVAWHESRDAHNWTAWRDTFDPHLANLLARVWS